MDASARRPTISATVICVRAYHGSTRLRDHGLAIHYARRGVQAAREAVPDGAAYHLRHAAAYRHVGLHPQRVSRNRRFSRRAHPHRFEMSALVALATFAVAYSRATAVLVDEFDTRRRVNPIGFVSVRPEGACGLWRARQRSTPWPRR